MTIDAKWFHREQWTLIEAAQICAGENPYQGGQSTDSPHVVSKQISNADRRELFSELYAQSKDAINRKALPLGESSRTGYVGNIRVRPCDYVKWAMDAKLPPPMRALIDRPTLTPILEQPGGPAAKGPEVVRPRGQSLRRQDALAIELDDICSEMKGKRITATAVFARLKRDSGKGGCVVDVSCDGSKLIWERTTGKPEEIDVAGIDKRISRWRKQSRG